MLSHESANGRTDRRMDGQTDAIKCIISLASIKTVCAHGNVTLWVSVITCDKPSMFVFLGGGEVVRKESQPVSIFRWCWIFCIVLYELLYTKVHFPEKIFHLSAMLRPSGRFRKFWSCKYNANYFPTQLVVKTIFYEPGLEIFLADKGRKDSPYSEIRGWLYFS